jgi:hypothetical protein
MTYYLTLFDGKKKTMEGDIEHICDALYHEDCVIIDKYGNKKCRDEMKKNHANKLEMGSKCSLLLFRVISFDTIEIKYSLQNDQEEKIINQLLTTNDNNQIVKAQVMIEKSLSKDEIVCQKLLKRTFPKKRQSKKEAVEDDKEQEQEKQSKRRKMGVEPKLNMTAPTAA